MIERRREYLSEPPTVEHCRGMAADGWKLVAVEWQRELPGERPGHRYEVPFGMRVASDCCFLEEDPSEKETMLVMLELIVRDRTVSQVAQELNRRGLRMRNGAEWTPAAVFDLHPRLIEACPSLFSSPEWMARSQARG